MPKPRTEVGRGQQEAAPHGATAILQAAHALCVARVDLTRLISGPEGQEANKTSYLVRPIARAAVEWEAVLVRYGGHPAMEEHNRERVTRRKPFKAGSMTVGGRYLTADDFRGTELSFMRQEDAQAMDSRSERLGYTWATELVIPDTELDQLEVFRIGQSEPKLAVPVYLGGKALDGVEPLTVK